MPGHVQVQCPSKGVGEARVGASVSVSVRVSVHAGSFLRFAMLVICLRVQLYMHLVATSCARSVCLSRFGGIMLRGCEHSFHRTCVAMYCKAEMDGGKTRLMCPLPECRRELAQRETRAIIGTENFAKLDRLALEEAVMADPTLHLCASPDCTFVASWAGPDDGLPRVVCPKCDTVRCLMCGRKWHGLEVSCAEASAAVPAAAAEALTMAYLKRTNVRRCARCGNGVVKSAGCNKMKCRCDYRFCYECGAENCTTAEGVNCGCTPAAHGYIDNVLGRGDFSGLAPAARPAHPS
eukprot:m.133817 g.133817  ORF g.133817 m.133817 type:complete len:293 (+) comp22501_c1_seq6:1010-1888(+)